VDENLSMPVTLTGLLRDLLNVGCSVPRHLMKVAFELALQSTEALKCVLPGAEDKMIWQEFQNKLQVFNLYEHVDLILGLSKDRPVSLREMVHRTSSLGPFFAPWAREGLKGAPPPQKHFSSSVAIIPSRICSAQLLRPLGLWSAISTLTQWSR
jgi:hypothetical protein